MNRITRENVEGFTFHKPLSPSTIIFFNDNNKYVKLIMKDTLEIENTMSLNEGALKFIDWIKTYYDCEMKRLKDENEFLKKEFENSAIP